MYSSLLLLLSLPFLAFAQSTTSSNANNTSSTRSGSASGSTSSGGSTSTAFTTVTSTSLSTFVGIVTSSGSRVESSLVSTHVFTTVVPVPTGNTTGNSTTTTSSLPTSTRILPTAPTDVNGGGVGGAPVPGAKTGNGALGPDDNYIAAASVLATKALVASLVACVVGGSLIVL